MSKVKNLALLVATMPALVHAHASRVLKDSKSGMTGLALLGTAGGVLAQTSTDPETPEAAVTQSRTKVAAVIAIGGVALVALALLSVGWEAAVKWVKKLRRAA
jgi:hypothetical protein